MSHPKTTTRRPGGPPTADMVWVPGGTFRMGSNDHYPEEAPAHDATVDGFWMDKHTVTNAQFRRFVEATGYVTIAERAPNAADYPGAKPELLVPASVVFRKPPAPSTSAITTTGAPTCRARAGDSRRDRGAR